MYECFNNIINKDFMSYDDIFNDIISNWKLWEENDNILILSDNIERSKYVIIDIITTYERVETLECKTMYGYYELIIYSRTKSNGVPKYLRFIIVDLNFKDSGVRGMKLNDIIIDVELNNKKDIYDLIEKEAIEKNYYQC